MFNVLVADKLAEEGIAALRERAGLDVEIAHGLSAPALAERLRSSHALIVRSATQVTRAVLASAERLQVIGRAGIGVDNIDVEAATERGIVVLNTPDANATTTAELTLAHM